MYAKFGVNKQIALKYHKIGLDQFLKSMLSLSKKKLIGESFLQEMNKIDLQWDKLMQKPISKEKSSKFDNNINSRDVEYKAGKSRNVFYPDSEKFINKWIDTYQDDIKLVVASNAHSSHIKGLLEGLNTILPDVIPIYGWDKIECTKSNPNYFSILKKQLKNESNENFELFMIGNSSNEMIGSAKSGFFPILIHRDREVSKKGFRSAKKVFTSLQGVWETIISEVN